MTAVEAHLCKEPTETVSLELIACIDGSFGTVAVVYTSRQVEDNEKARHYHFSRHDHDVRSFGCWHVGFARRQRSGQNGRFGTFQSLIGGCGPGTNDVGTAAKDTSLGMASYM